MEAEELLKKLHRYKPYWKNKGGITVSGGEANAADGISHRPLP